MTEQEIKNKVYELLWELFYGKCPSIDSRYDKSPDRLARIWDIGTILFEILPAEISIGGIYSIDLFYWQGIDDEGNGRIHQLGYHNFADMDLVILTCWHHTIWKALLSLLLELKKLVKDKGDDVKMIWGK